MAAYQIENEKLAIRVDLHGAELRSLKNKSTGAEYMWSGDPSYWGRVSPVLFPFVGGSYQKEYRTKGKTYAMCQHGFARDMDFELILQQTNKLVFQLKSSEETLEKYPYEFVLKIGYELQETSVIVSWIVENPAEEEMYFAIGGHPGFCCPPEEGQQQTDCSLKLDEKATIISTEINGQGMATKTKNVYELNQGILPITDHLFDKDALIIEDQQIKEVSLCDPAGKPYLKVRMDAPLFGLWSPPGKKAPFICIEPWYGRCDKENYQGELKDRDWENTLAPGSVWNASYEIVIEP